jgi:signal transduction histidine kinase
VETQFTEALLGAVREALKNIIKHSGANRAVLTLAREGDGIRIGIRDHGKGFSQTEVTQGFGMKNSIIARLLDVGGSASIESEIGRGTKVTLWVPARSAHRAISDESGDSE